MNLREAKTIGRVLNALCFLTAGCSFIYPHPYLLIYSCLSILPPCAIFLSWRYQNLFSIEGKGPNPLRVELTPVLLLPGFAQMLQALRDAQMVDASQLITPTLVGVAFLMFCILRVAPSYRENLGTLILAIALIATYPGGTLAIANFLFDKSPVKQLLLPVVSKRYTTGKGAVTFLQFPTQKILGYIDEVKVPRDMYQNTAIGQFICVSVYAGALGFEWFAVGPEESCHR